MVECVGDGGGFPSRRGKEGEGVEGRSESIVCSTLTNVQVGEEEEKIEQLDRLNASSVVRFCFSFKTASDHCC